MTLSSPSTLTRTAERFPYLTHRTVAEIYGPNLEQLRVCRVSTANFIIAQRIAQRRNG